MQIAYKICFALICFSALIAAEPRVPLKNLMQFLEHEHELSRQNPQRSLVCFDCYLPLLTVIAEEFETSYEACIETATVAKSRLNNETESEREQIANSMQSTCELFNVCNEHADSLAYFECYANAGTENKRVLNAVSSNATEMLTSVREQYRAIETEEQRCTNASERSYVKKTASTYEQLQKCLHESAQPEADSAAPAEAATAAAPDAIKAETPAGATSSNVKMSTSVVSSVTTTSNGTS